MAAGIRSRVRSTWVLALVALIAVLALALADDGGLGPRRLERRRASERRAGERSPQHRLRLTHDLSWNLLKYMPTCRRCKNQGETFSRYFVTDSLVLSVAIIDLHRTCGRTTQA